MFKVITDVVLLSLLLILNMFLTYFKQFVSIVVFEQVNVNWDSWCKMWI